MKYLTSQWWIAFVSDHWLGDPCIPAEHDKTWKGPYCGYFLDVWNLGTGTCCNIYSEQIRGTWFHGGTTWGAALGRTFGANSHNHHLSVLYRNPEGHDRPYSADRVSSRMNSKIQRLVLTEWIILAATSTNARRWCPKMWPIRWWRLWWRIRYT